MGPKTGKRRGPANGNWVIQLWTPLTTRDGLWARRREIAVSGPHTHNNHALVLWKTSSPTCLIFGPATCHCLEQRARESESERQASKPQKKDRDRREGKGRRWCLGDWIDSIPCCTTFLHQDDLKKRVNIITATCWKGCFEKMDDQPVAITPNHHLPVVVVLL